MSESTNKFWATLSGLVLGATAGAAAMFFLSPRSGKENRRLAKAKYKELADYVEEERTAFEDKVEDIFGEVNEITTSLFNDAKRLWNTQVEAFEKSLDKIDKNRYQEMVDGVMEKLQSNKKYDSTDLAKMKRYLANEWKKFSQMMD